MPFLILILIALLAPAAGAQCTHPLAPTSWVETCAQPTGTGGKLGVSLSTHIERLYTVMNRNATLFGVATCSVNRVGFRLTAVQGASEFPIDTVLSFVRPTTHVLPPLSAVSVLTPVDALIVSEFPVPAGLVTTAPWSLRIEAVGGAFLQHSGCLTSTIDFAADASVTVSYLP